MNQCTLGWRVVGVVLGVGRIAIIGLCLNCSFAVAAAQKSSFLVRRSNREKTPKRHGKTTTTDDQSYTKDMS